MTHIDLKYTQVRALKDTAKLKKRSADTTFVKKRQIFAESQISPVIALFSLVPQFAFLLSFFFPDFWKSSPTYSTKGLISFWK